MARITDFDDDIKNRIIKIFKYHVDNHPKNIKISKGNDYDEPLIELKLGDSTISAKGNFVNFSSNQTKNRFNVKDVYYQDNYLEFKVDDKDKFSNIIKGTKEYLETLVYKEYQKITGEKLNNILDN